MDPCLAVYHDFEIGRHFSMSVFHLAKLCKTGMNGMAQCPSFDATKRRFTQHTGLPANLQESLNELDHLKCAATIRIDDFEPGVFWSRLSAIQIQFGKRLRQFHSCWKVTSWLGPVGVPGHPSKPVKVFHASYHVISYFGWILKLNTKTMLDLETSDSPKVGQFEKVPGHFGLGWPAKIIPLWSRCSPEAEKIATENMAPTSCRASKNQNMTEYQSMPVI